MFDPAVPAEWCELIKDIVAIANSGGGIIVFGLRSDGSVADQSVSAIESIDPADIGSKIGKYTGPVDLEFEIRALTKDGHRLISLVIKPVAIPLVFQKPGTYDVGGGKQKTAFAVGTVYFRHGAKSEPGTSDDLRRAMERQLEAVRRRWLKGVRKVVKAPSGVEVIAVQSTRQSAPLPTIGQIRVVDDPHAVAIRLTRDKEGATGTFVHEEISEGIFDEINNVVDANRLLSRGADQFLLGQSLYYRIYAERQHVKQPEDTIALLLRDGVAFYAPALFWLLVLPDAFAVATVKKLYLYPSTPAVHTLIRLGLLLGREFCQWLLQRWDRKWRNQSQPPAFYWNLKEIAPRLENTDGRLLAARASVVTRYSLSGESTDTARSLLERPAEAIRALSRACMLVFHGDKTYRTIARNLDYLAFGTQVQERAGRLVPQIIAAVGERDPGDVIETPDGD